MNCFNYLNIMFIVLKIAANNKYARFCKLYE